MSKYDPLWKWIQENGKGSFRLTFAQIEEIAGFPVDHSFLTYKKELPEYGYRIEKISLKEKNVSFVSCTVEGQDKEKDLKQIFEAENISFVEVSKDMIEDYLAMVNDHENVNRFLGSWKSESYTEEDEIAWVEKKLDEKATVFSMIEKKTGEFIGNIELVDVNGPEAELGIAITAKKQDLGYGSEAVKAMTDYGFDQLGLKRIVLRARPFNDRAIHVYRKCGFREYRRTDDHVYMEVRK